MNNSIDRDTLTVSRQTNDTRFFMAEYRGKKTYELAFDGSIIDAINEACNAWGLHIDNEEVLIIASN